MPPDEGLGFPAGDPENQVSTASRLAAGPAIGGRQLSAVYPFAAASVISSSMFMSKGQIEMSIALREGEWFHSWTTRRRNRLDPSRATIAVLRPSGPGTVSVTPEVVHICRLALVSTR